MKTLLFIILLIFVSCETKEIVSPCVSVPVTVEICDVEIIYKGGTVPDTIMAVFDWAQVGYQITLIDTTLTWHVFNLEYADARKFNCTEE